jgi:hypothetical protein
LIELGRNNAADEAATCVLTHQRYEPRDGGYRIVLDAYGYHWLRAGGLEKQADQLER